MIDTEREKHADAAKKHDEAVRAEKDFYKKSCRTCSQIFGGRVAEQVSKKAYIKRTAYYKTLSDYLTFELFKADAGHSYIVNLSEEDKIALQKMRFSDEEDKKAG